MFRSTWLTSAAEKAMMATLIFPTHPQELYKHEEV
jgi:hypothetical protein